MSTSTKVLDESVTVGMFQNLVGASLPFTSVVNMVMNFILEIQRILLGRTWLGLKKTFKPTKSSKSHLALGKLQVRSGGNGAEPEPSRIWQEALSSWQLC